MHSILSPKYAKLDYEKDGQKARTLGYGAQVVIDMPRRLVTHSLRPEHEPEVAHRCNLLGIPFE